MAKLSMKDAKKIRKLYANGYDQDTLAQAYRVSQSTISNVIRNRNFVEDVYQAPEIRRKPLDRTSVERIRQLRAEGNKHVYIAHEVGCDESTVSRILKREAQRDSEANT